jgi:hypothetical protein
MRKRKGRDALAEVERMQTRRNERNKLCRATEQFDVGRDVVLACQSSLYRMYHDSPNQPVNQPNHALSWKLLSPAKTEWQQVIINGQEHPTQCKAIIMWLNETKAVGLVMSLVRSTGNETLVFGIPCGVSEQALIVDIYKPGTRYNLFNDDIKQFGTVPEAISACLQPFVDPDLVEARFTLPADGVFLAADAKWWLRPDVQRSVLTHLQIFLLRPLCDLVCSFFQL